MSKTSDDACQSCFNNGESIYFNKCFVGGSYKGNYGSSRYREKGVLSNVYKIH